MRSLRVIAIAATVLLGATLLSSCTNNTDPAGPTDSAIPSVTTDSTLASQLPDAIKSRGTLIVGISPPYAPNEYLNGAGELVGFDVDLMDATAKVLGLKTDYRQSQFDKIIPSVTAGSYDVGDSSFADTAEREKTVQFVNYFAAGSLWVQRSGESVNPDSACGLTVGVQTTSAQDTDEVPTRSAACVKLGKPEIKKVQYDSQDDVTNAVLLGKVAAMSADAVVSGWAIKQSGGKLTAAGAMFDSVPYGWAVAPGSPMAGLLQRALQRLIDSGSYQQICAKWGNQLGAIKTATINAAGTTAKP